MPWLVAVLGLVLVQSTPLRADVLDVPDSVRRMSAPHEEVHALRARDGTLLGHQRSVATRDGDRLVLDLITQFTNGERWDEHAEMNIAHGYRPILFTKTGRRPGSSVAEVRVDFTTGSVTWMADGVRDSKIMTLAPDTYLGPMYGVVLAAVAARPSRAGTLSTLVFDPVPTAYTLRADVIEDDGTFRFGTVSEPAIKVRLKADLGPVQNVVFASLIPTHYFWFTREQPPEFYAFEGTLGYGGPELVMVPERPPTSTAQAGRR